MSDDPPPPVLPYADLSTPAGVTGLQVIAVHPDVRRIVPESTRPTRRLAFEVTPFALVKIEADLFGVARVAWPRAAVDGVKVNRPGNRLVLKLRGRPPVEVEVGWTLDDTELVMHELLNALTIIAPAPVAQQVAEPGVAGGLALPAPTRSALLTVAGALFAAGAVLLFVPPHGVGVGLIAIGVVVAGLVVGTHGGPRGGVG